MSNGRVSAREEGRVGTMRGRVRGRALQAEEGAGSGVGGRKRWCQKGRKGTSGWGD